MTMPPSSPLDSSPAIAAETPDAIADRVLSVISTTKRLPREAVTPETSFESLGIDSLDRLNILFDLENEFDIQINDEEAKQVSTIREMISGVEHLVATRGKEPPAAAAAPAPAIAATSSFEPGSSESEPTTDSSGPERSSAASTQ